MRVIISNNDKIQGTSNNFKVSIPFGVDDTKFTYKVYIENIVISSDDTTADVPWIELNSVALSSTNDFYSSDKNGLIAIVPHHSIFTTNNYYLHKKTNSIPDFEITYLPRIVDFSLTFDGDELDPNIIYAVTIILNLIKVD